MSDAGSKNPKEAARADAKSAKATKRREVNKGTNVAVGQHAREAGYDTSGLDPPDGFDGAVGIGSGHDYR